MELLKSVNKLGTYSNTDGFTDTPLKDIITNALEAKGMSIDSIRYRYHDVSTIRDMIAAISTTHELKPEYFNMWFNLLSLVMEIRVSNQERLICKHSTDSSRMITRNTLVSVLKPTVHSVYGDIESINYRLDKLPDTVGLTCTLMGSKSLMSSRDFIRWINVLALDFDWVINIKRNPVKEY